MKKSLALALYAAALVPALALGTPAAQAIPVFDGANYAQNLLIAARTLQAVNQQIASLQNEAAMLVDMEKHLRRFDFPELKKLHDNLARIDALMQRADSVGLDIDRLESRMAALFPTQPTAGTPTSRLAAAKARLDAARAGYRRTLAVQARIVADVREDAGLLARLGERSSAAAGSLQAQQAANQLLALAAKQQMQLQLLLAAQYQADSLARSREAQIEAEGRESTRRFLGTGQVYTPR